MPDISKRLERAEKYVQKGKLDAGLEEYLAAWKEDPNNDSLVEIIAELYSRQELPRNALECYGFLFDKYLERNEGQRASIIFRKMSKVGAPDATRMLAFAGLQEKQKPQEAVEAYREASHAFTRAGDREHALEALAAVARLNDKDPDAQLALAGAAQAAGQKDTAAEAYARAGELLKAAGHPGGAVEVLERAHQALPSEPRVAQALAAILQETGNSKRAAELLEPFAAQAGATGGERSGAADRNRQLAEAHLANGNLARAEELLSGMAQTQPDVHPLLLRVAEGYVQAHKPDAAVALLRKVKGAMFAAKKEREFVSAVEAVQKASNAGVQVLEFLSSVYNELNYDSLLQGTQARLFDAYVETGDYEKAGNALDRLVDVDPYDSGHKGRLERLAGKVDERRYQALSSRFTQAAAAAPAAVQVATAPDTTAGTAPAAPERDAAASLEDLILQAEIFLQYGLRQRAVEKLQTIARMFPGEEAQNEKLQALYTNAQFQPQPVAGAARGGAAAAAASPAPESAEDAAADLTRVSEITRNIYRQGTVKAVLSTSVNEIGRTWRVSRCVAGLCTPGKPPSAALEFCATGMKQSDVRAIVKLVTNLVQLTSDGNPLAAEDAATSARLKQLVDVVGSLEIKSLLALPLIDSDQPVGVVVLEQCDRMRRWRSNEIVLLKTVADQMVIATSHVKLRSLMRTLAVADERSGLLNRSSYVDCLLSECGRAAKQNTPLSVVLLHFGHARSKMREYGDEAVQAYMQDASSALVGHLRQNDIGIRYDTTTIALVLPDTKGQDGIAVVEKLRKVVSTIKLNNESLPLSGGVAQAVVKEDMETVDSVTDIINRAEAALEQARKETNGVKLLEAVGI